MILVISVQLTGNDIRTSRNDDVTALETLDPFPPFLVRLLPRPLVSLTLSPREISSSFLSFSTEDSHECLGSAYRQENFSIFLSKAKLFTGLIVTIIAIR